MVITVYKHNLKVEIIDYPKLLVCIHVLQVHKELTKTFL